MLRTLVLGVAVLLIAGVAAVAYVGLGTAAPPAAAAVPMLTVLAAAHSVHAGSLLQPGDLVARQIAANAAPAGARQDSAEARNALVGAMVRRTLNEQDVIGGDDVLRPGDHGFLAAVLAPGTRAVSVAVDAVSGEAGLIWPGDRVDLILTQEITDAEQTLAHRYAGETVLDDVRVIAVDQQLVQGGQASGVLSGQQAARTITLEVTSKDAARIAVATRLGKLQVVLRAAPAIVTATMRDSDIAAATPVLASAMPGTAPRTAAPGPTAISDASNASAAAAGVTVWGGDVSRALTSHAAAPGTEVRVFQGTKSVEAYKF